MDFTKVEDLLGYQFKNKLFLKEALTHKSNDENFNNERLEFLGDSVISLAVSEELLLKEANLDEGSLSIYRSKIVSRSNLSDIGAKLNLDKYLLASSALKNNQNLTNSVIGNTFEAVLGAVFLDAGYKKAKEIILSLLKIDFFSLAEDEQKDPKTRLQEFLQSSKEDLPEYLTVEKKSAAGNKFVSKVFIPNLSLDESGEGKTKKIAEQRAAEKILIKIISNGK
ncbi:MAG: ribonuclease III [Gammaproteobacteria bacterium]